MQWQRTEHRFKHKGQRVIRFTYLLSAHFATYRVFQNVAGTWFYKFTFHLFPRHIPHHMLVQVTEPCAGLMAGISACEHHFYAVMAELNKFRPCLKDSPTNLTTA